MRSRHFFVTHIYAFAKKAYDEERPRTQFLQAERTSEGERTYIMRHGEPGTTGYGMELYNDILGGTYSGNKNTGGDTPGNADGGT